MGPYEVSEVRVLRHDRSLSFARRKEDRHVLCITEPERANRFGFELKLRLEPGTELRGKLRVDPDLHAATIG